MYHFSEEKCVVFVLFSYKNIKQLFSFCNEVAKIAFDTAGNGPLKVGLYLPIPSPPKCRKFRSGYVQLGATL